MLPQRTSRKGREFLVREEGLIPHAYNDPVGHATFGVGHLLHFGPVTAADERKWGSKSRPKSRAFVMRVFKRDLKPYEKAVRKAVGRRLPQHRFDALVSLCFNIGTGGFATSTAARCVRERKGTAAIVAGIRMWDNPSMLRPRREREVALFVHGRYGL